MCVMRKTMTEKGKRQCSVYPLGCLGQSKLEGICLK